jgi:diguanylate cyclase (GGDEF)-like protein
MVLTNKEATVIIAAPQRYAAMLPDLSDININHRKYFHDTKRTLAPVVSRAIRGRGLGNFDIVAITAPILLNNEFNGLLQAAIKLDKFVDESVLNAFENNQISVLLVDDEDSIIYSTPALGLNQLDTFVENSGPHPFSADQRAMKINDSDYLYVALENERGWKIYAFTPPIRVFEEVTEYFLLIIITLLSSMLFITILSKGLAAKIVIPLLNLEKVMSGKGADKRIIAASKISKEMENVTNNVIKYQKLSEDFQSELKAQVEDKTQSLQDLNEALVTLSQTDSLTGLYNRGAFDSLAKNTYKYYQRHKKPFTLAIIDIDHFKEINDTFGHVTGDACISEVAHLIQSKCRRETDIVARYGGEEYIMLLASDQYENHDEYVKSIHKSIEEGTFVYNGLMIEMTVSVGVLKVSTDFSQDFITLIELADEKLYESKRSGRNRVSVGEI